MADRSDGFYNVKFNGEWIVAKYVTNQDIDSSYNCWRIDGITKPWGFDVNETKHNIEILDSTWFTTIVRSEGFNVGGHFRMQPFGPKLSDRKLIWISPFEKDGYTRKAKILSNEINLR